LRRSGHAIIFHKMRLKMNVEIEEILMAKQTGHGCAVKSVQRLSLARYTALGTLLLLVSGCASTWHHPAKSPQEASADEKLCATEAEDTALTRAARQKVDYERMQQNSPIASNGRGETPMQLADRGHTEDVYAREFQSCMRRKGYTQGK
jgi:hypothetical protein